MLTSIKRRSVDAARVRTCGHLVIMLNQLAEISDDLIEELGKLRPEVIASLTQATRDIKRGRYRELTSIAELA